jgi:hypothetical protein
VEWPGRARIALLVMPALEWFPLDMTGKPFRAPGGLERPYPDYRYYTSRDYGNRFRTFITEQRKGERTELAQTGS